MVTELTTERLRLRAWRRADREPWALLNADAETMRYFPATLNRAQSETLADRITTELNRDGWGLWAVEILGSDPFIGFVGLSAPSFDAHFTPAVEVGWRLTRARWGNGYATEAAGAALDFAFDQLQLGEVVSFTATSNDRSRAVMAKLHMTRTPHDDFDHPRVPAGPLRRQVLYRLTSQCWRESKADLKTG